MCFNWSRWVALLDTRSSDGPSENQFNASDHPESVPYEYPAPHSSFGLSYVFMPSIIYTRQRLRLGNAMATVVPFFRTISVEASTIRRKRGRARAPGAARAPPTPPASPRPPGPRGPMRGPGGRPGGYPPGPLYHPSPSKGDAGFWNFG